MQIAQESSPWQELYPTKVDKKPFSPNINRDLIVITFFSLLIGALITFLRDTMDNLFHSPKEIEEYLKIPMLGNIPYIKSLDNTRNIENQLINSLLELDNFDVNDKIEEISLKDKRYEKFTYQESFRNLYTALRFANIDKKVKKILITSSIPKEGKSLINIVLAKTLADIGIKVLLIDSDMRKPQIHKRLSLNNILGFSNLLIDKKNELKNLIQEIPTVPNLKILTSGRTVPDTTRLLRSERMKELMNSLENEDYDYVIFDPPPILGISDTSLISEYCDGSILIVSIEKVKKITIKFLADETVI